MFPLWDPPLSLSVQVISILKFHSPKLWPSVWNGACLFLAASVLTLPTPLSIFAYKHFPDFFLALHMAGTYSLSPLILRIFLFQLGLLSPSISSLPRTFFSTSHGNGASDPAPFCELVLLISPWECREVKLVGRSEFADIFTPRKESQRYYGTWYKPEKMSQRNKALHIDREVIDWTDSGDTPSCTMAPCLHKNLSVHYCTWSISGRVSY